MPRVKPGERQREYRPKTRTGCQTCKSVISSNIWNMAHADHSLQKWVALRQLNLAKPNLTVTYM
jgi:hypothetical protein